jgi:hypothetical protein
MGLLRNLEIMLGTAITQRVHGRLYDWIEAVSQLLDGEGGPAGGLAVGSAFGMTQGAWFVDPINGNDANDGKTMATALKTDARRQVLWGGSLPTLLANPTAVNYLSSPPSSDPVNFNVSIAGSAGLLVQGTRTTVATGTFTGVTVQNRGTQTPFSVTDAALPGGFTAHVGRLLRITSGARVNAYARIVKDLGGGSARISPFGTFSPTLFAFFSQVTPQMGDPYEIVTLPTIGLGNFNAALRSNLGVVNAAIPQNCVTFDSLNVNGNLQVGIITGTSIPIFVQRSILSQLAFESDLLQVAGGGCDDALFVRAGFSQFNGTGALVGAGLRFILENMHVVQLDGDCLFQNASVGMDGGSMLVNGAACFDNAIADDCFVVAGPAASMCRVNGPLWGTNNAGHGVRIISARSMDYTTGLQPTVNVGLGANREALVGGTDKLWAAIPFINPANNAQIVISG